MVEWFGAGFLASGAAATDEVVEEAAIPFDRRRHGLIMGMGAASLVVESAEAARERGIQPICEVLSAVTANSAFHGTRLDVQHIGQVMEDLVGQAESCAGIQRQQLAPQMVFVSHETYTPARGGSASAEVHALRHVFGDGADQIVVANTKGLTGHAMATGIEDVLAVKALETGLVPPVANFKEVDPELGLLNLSKGGSYPVQYALHLGAGFGSQISMMLLRWIKTPDGVHRTPDKLGYAYRIADPAVWSGWLSRVAGYAKPELEVVKRTLRVHDKGPQARVAPIVQESRPVVAPAAATVTAQPASAVVAKAVAETKPVAAPPIATPEIAKAVPAVKAAVQSAAPIANTDAVKERILALAVDKTGYPADMLDLDLDLEADLGVDTVKQAEIFAAIREMYNIPRDENRKLRDYPTLAHVIRFVYENRPDLAGKSAAPATVPVAGAPTVQPVATPTVTVATPAEGPQAASSISLDSIKAKVMEIVAEKTGYPPEMLDLDLDLEADLGIDTVKQAEMFAAVRAAYNIPRDENMKLRDFPTLAHVIQFAQQRQPGAVSTASAITAKEKKADVVAVAPVAPASPATATVSAVAAVSLESIKAKVLEIVAEKTGLSA